MCTPGTEETSSIAIMLAIDSGLKCTSLGKNLKGAIFVKVFEYSFLYIIKVSSELQSQILPIIYLLMHKLEVRQVSMSIHELEFPVLDLLPVSATPPRPPPSPWTIPGVIRGQFLKCVHIHESSSIIERKLNHLSWSRADSQTDNHSNCLHCCPVLGIYCFAFDYFDLHDHLSLPLPLHCNCFQLNDIFLT